MLIAYPGQSVLCYAEAAKGSLCIFVLQRNIFVYPYREGIHLLEETSGESFESIWR